MDLAKSAVKSGSLSYLPCIVADKINYLLQSKSRRVSELSKLKNLLACPAHHEALSTIVEMHRQGIGPEDDVWNEFLELIGDYE